LTMKPSSSSRCAEQALRPTLLHAFIPISDIKMRGVVANAPHEVKESNVPNSAAAAAEPLLTRLRKAQGHPGCGRIGYVNVSLTLYSLEALCI